MRKMADGETTKETRDQQLVQCHSLLPILLSFRLPPLGFQQVQKKSPCQLRARYPSSFGATLATKEPKPNHSCSVAQRGLLAWEMPTDGKSLSIL